MDAIAMISETPSELRRDVRATVQTGIRLGRVGFELHHVRPPKDGFGLASPQRGHLDGFTNGSTERPQ